MLGLRNVILGILADLKHYYRCCHQITHIQKEINKAWKKADITWLPTRSLVSVNLALDSSALENLKSHFRKNLASHLMTKYIT